MDQLTALRALRRVVELGSFTAAANALGISHSIVSRQIRQLENQLGAQLLNRTTRRFALTAAGQQYYLASRDILDALDAADRAVMQQQAQPSGSLRINAPMAFGALELAAWLPPFAARYPQLQLDLVCNDRMVDLIEEGFDVALRLTRGLPDSTLVARKLASSRMVAVASPAYLARHGRPVSPADRLSTSAPSRKSAVTMPSAPSVSYPRNSVAPTRSLMPYQTVSVAASPEPVQAARAALR